MKPRFDDWTSVLFCGMDDASSLRSAFSADRDYVVQDDVIAWRLEKVPDLNQIVESLTSTLQLSRYLDKYYILHHAHSRYGVQKIISKMFELLADRYDQIVDVSRNYENITNLMCIIKKHFGSLESKQLLDFGCGTGLSSDVAREFGVDVLGTDRSDAMLACAKLKGMTTINFGELSQRRKDIDAVFASYVLHFPIQLTDLGIVLAKIKRNGLLACNFHKNERTNEVDSYVESLGGVVYSVEPTSTIYNHGAYRKYLLSE